jgi:predicted amidohydrolase YtcJ
MKMMYRCVLAAILVAAPTLAVAHNELAREPRGIDTLVPAGSAPPQADSSARKITIYTAKTIVTLDPGTPSAQAVAVMNGKILGVGTLNEVRGWITDEEFEIDRRFQDAVIVPGFIEAHMHPQFTGVLWQGVYVGRFDRTSPDGTPIKGLETKEAVIERLRNAAAKMPADGRWLVAWGYQPEFYGNSPLTRADLDPISNGHPFFIENLSMHIYYVNSKAFDVAGITDDTDIAGIIKKAGKPTGEIQEIEAALAFVAKLPPIDSETLLKATWDAAKLAHRVGVTTFADLNFGDSREVTKPIRRPLPIPTSRYEPFSIH